MFFRKDKNYNNNKENKNNNKEEKEIVVEWIKSRNLITGEKEIAKIILDNEKEMKVSELFKSEIAKNPNIIACRVNNAVKSLLYVVKENCSIELIDTYNEDGRNIYIRTLIYIMSKAIYDLYKDAKITVEYQLSNAMYISLVNMDVTDQFIDNIRNRMKEIVEKDLPIKRKVMTKEEAKVFYEENKTKRGYLQLENINKDKVTLYYCEDYFNYFYGIMPESTGIVNKFEIEKYDKGFIVKYPERKDFSKVADFKDNKKLKFSLEEYNDIYKVLKLPTVHHLNKMILKNPKQVVLLSEALHEKKIFDISKKILKKEDVKMILIAGPSSSGKTTFAGKLANALRIRGIKPVTISVDNYFVERTETPLDENGKPNFESINAIDLELFNDHLDRLIKGEEISVPTFNFIKGEKEYLGNKMKLHDDEILVIEGIHCLNDKLTEKISNDKKFKIYISALTVMNIDYFNRISTTDTRLIRRILRDYRTRGYSAKRTIEMWPSVRRGEFENIFPYQEEADFMFNSSVLYEMSVLKKHIVPLLEEITNEEEEYSEARRLLGMLKYFEDIEDEIVPVNSLVREFLGNSIFE